MRHAASTASPPAGCAPYVACSLGAALVVQPLMEVRGGACREPYMEPYRRHAFPPVGEGTRSSGQPVVAVGGMRAVFHVKRGTLPPTAPCGEHDCPARTNPCRNLRGSRVSPTGRSCEGGLACDRANKRTTHTSPFDCREPGVRGAQPSNRAPDAEASPQGPHPASLGPAGIPGGQVAVA